MKEKIERQVFQYGLIIAIAFQLYQVLASIIPVIVIENALLDIVIALILAFILFLSYKSKNLVYLILALHLVALAGFSFFWINYGGFAGSIPGFVCAYVGFAIVISNGKLQAFLLITIVMLIVLFLFFPNKIGMLSYSEPHHVNTITQNLDFIIIGFLILAFSSYLKSRYLFYRAKSLKRNKLLDSVAKRLAKQNEELDAEQDEVRAINENLEAIVEERTRELDHKNRTLEEYAFINAHLVRGPLSRVIGLCNLMEKDSGFDQIQIKLIKEKANEMDRIVRKINEVVS
jgi:signal transduction histidine kinase